MQRAPVAAQSTAEHARMENDHLREPSALAIRLTLCDWYTARGRAEDRLSIARDTLALHQRREGLSMGAALERAARRWAEGGSTAV